MIDLYVQVAVKALELGLPGAIIFALTNKVVDMILTAAFGGRFKI